MLLNTSSSNISPSDEHKLCRLKGVHSYSLIPRISPSSLAVSALKNELCTPSNRSVWVTAYFRTITIFEFQGLEGAWTFPICIAYFPAEVENIILSQNNNTYSQKATKQGKNDTTMFLHNPLCK